MFLKPLMSFLWRSVPSEMTVEQDPSQVTSTDSLEGPTPSFTPSLLEDFRVSFLSPLLLSCIEVPCVPVWVWPEFRHSYPKKTSFVTPDAPGPTVLFPTETDSCFRLQDLSPKDTPVRDGFVVHGGEGRRRGGRCYGTVRYRYSRTLEPTERMDGFLYFLL